MFLLKGRRPEKYGDRIRCVPNKPRGGELGASEPWHFYWLSGALSSFLDNAPTDLTFVALAQELHEAGQEAVHMAGGQCRKHSSPRSPANR